MRLAPVITAAIALAVVGCAHAETYIWDGEKTNWEYDYNWKGASVYGPEKVSRTVIDTALPVTAYVTGSPYLGSSIRLAKTGRLVLRSATPGEEVKLIFSNGTSSSRPRRDAELVATYYSGQQRGGRSDIHCPSNWQLSDGSPAVTAPCDRDEMVIAEGDSVALSTVEQRTTVKAVKIGDTDVTCSELSEMNFIRIPCTALHIDKEEVCFNNLCRCPSACPSLEELIEDNKNSREEANLVAEENKKESLKVVQRDISGTFSVEDLGMTPETLGKLLDGEDGDKVKLEIEEAIKEAIKERLGGDEAGADVVLKKVVIDKDNGVEIEASVTGTKKTFMGGDDTPGDVPDSGTIDLNAPGGDVGGDDGDAKVAEKFADLVKHAVGSHLSDKQKEKFEDKVEELKENCAGDCAAAAEAADVLAELPGTEAEKVVKAILDSDCEKEESLDNKTSCIEDAIAAAAPGSTVVTQERLAEAMAKMNLTVAAVSEPESPASILVQLAALEDEKEVAANLRASSGLPAETQMESPPIVLGQGLGRPAEDYGLIVSPPNSEVFAQEIVDALENFGPIIDTFVSTVEYELVVSDLPSRRRETKAIVEEMTVKFRYTTLCTQAEIDSGDCGFKKGDADYTSIQGLLNDVLNSFEIAPPECLSLESGFDAECLAQKAIDAYTAAKKAGKSDAEAAAAANAALQALVECGLLGRNPSTGECVEQDEAALDGVGGLTADAAAAYNAANPPTTTEPPENQKTGGGSIVPIAAGAGAGALILIIIIVVVVLKRRDNDGSAAASDKTPARSVVAFENPMYDDPGQAPEAAYAGADGPDEGLYDEPAFNSAQNDRNNPLYQSNEDLAGAGEEETGYLDVAPEE